MKDFLNKELQINDKVILVRPGYKYFLKGTVSLITPKKVGVKFWNNIYNQEDFTYKFPKELIKYD